MSIELHCFKCGKLIRAPDDAGGRHGKCPYCKESVYVPMPPEKIEPIPIAPVDEEEEQRLARLRREAIAYAATLDHETVTHDGEGEGGGGPGSELPPGEVVDLRGEVESFILAMRDSKLDEADAAVARVKSAGPRARDFVQGLLLDEMPPRIEGVPPPLVQGFLKTLLARLG